MLNENIKAIRKSKGLSQEELAVKLIAERSIYSKFLETRLLQDLHPATGAFLYRKVILPNIFCNVWRNHYSRHMNIPPYRCPRSCT